MRLVESIEEREMRKEKIRNIIKLNSCKDITGEILEKSVKLGEASQRKKEFEVKRHVRLHKQHDILSKKRKRNDSERKIEVERN